MRSGLSRKMLVKLSIQLGVVFTILILILYPRGQSEHPSPENTPTSVTGLLTGAGAGSRPSPTRTAPTPTPTHTKSVTQASFAVAGASVWILSCLNGWQTQKIYQNNPYYTNQQGVQKAKDVYVFGHFWLQPDTGALWPFSESPAELSCLSNLIDTVHNQYHGRVCGVLAADESGVETPKKWRGYDVAVYTRRAVANPSLLAPIMQQARRYPYDCLINDIEDGYNTLPQLFSQYDTLLHNQLTVPLGQTLLWKTAQVSSAWQTWEDWSTLTQAADFFIVMALDHDSINSPAVPSSVVDAGWARQVYAYMRSVPHLFGQHPVAWEFPTYYRMFTRQANGSWAVSSGTDVQAQLTLALQASKVPQNASQNPNNAYVEYTNTAGQDTYLFFETAKSSDTLAQMVSGLSQSCLMASFWDNDSGTANSLGWGNIASDSSVPLC